MSDEGNDQPGFFHFFLFNDEQRVPKKGEGGSHQAVFCVI